MTRSIPAPALRGLIALLSLLGAASTLAQPAPLDFGRARDLAVEVDADVAAARLELTTARADRDRLAADPLVLRVPRLQAQQALAVARAELALAEARARDAAASAYTDALEGDDQVGIAARARDLAATRLDAARIRADAGAANRLDVERAANDLATAEQTLDDARQSALLARDRLVSLTGTTELPDALPRELPAAEIPSLDDALSELDANAQLLRARHAVELAEARLAAVDNAYSARADVEAARTNLESAGVRIADVERGLTLSVRQAHNAVLAAAGRLANAEAAVTTAREELAAQRVRFEAGSVARLDLTQSELDAARAEANRDAARFALLAALRALDLTVQGAR